MTTSPQVNTFLGKIALFSFWMAVLAIITLVILGITENPPPYGTRELVTHYAMRNGHIFVKNTLPRTKRCASTVHRSIIDSTGVIVFSQSDYRPRIEDSTVERTSSRKLPIPDFASTGRAEYRVTIEWVCNPLQRMWPRVQDLPILEFTIIK